MMSRSTSKERFSQEETDMKGVLSIFKDNDLRKWEKLEKVYNCKQNVELLRSMEERAAEPGRDLNVQGHFRFI